MKNSLLRVIILLSIFLCEGAMAQKKLNASNDIIPDINADTVEKLEIIYIPSSVLTRVDISPDWLENHYFYKLILKEGGRVYLRSLMDALNKTNISKSNKTGDVRWGIILYDSSGKRILSIYVGGFGSNGYIHSNPVNFTSKSGEWLFWWLENNFSSIFK